MTIYKNRFYVLEWHEGISGFRSPDISLAVVSGHKAAHNRYDVLGEYLPTSDDYFRLEDGHLHDYQPRGRAEDAMRFLRENPFSRVIPLCREGRVFYK